MYIILLKLTEKKSEASLFMEAHNDWIRAGKEDGVFLLVGSLKSMAGGCIIANDSNLDAITQRVEADPFVQEQIVAPEIIEVAPHSINENLVALLQN